LDITDCDIQFPGKFSLASLSTRISVQTLRYAAYVFVAQCGMLSLFQRMARCRECSRNTDTSGGGLIRALGFVTLHAFIWWSAKCRSFDIRSRDRKVIGVSSRNVTPRCVRSRKLLSLSKRATCRERSFRRGTPFSRTGNSSFSIAASVIQGWLGQRSTSSRVLSGLVSLTKFALT
jgi:hypothetical protein